MSYCSIPDVKTFANFLSYEDAGFATDDDYESHISERIAMGSRAIDTYCDRPNQFFATGGVTVTQYFDGKGANPEIDMLQTLERVERYRDYARHFILKHKPVISITTVKEYVSGSWQTRTAGRSNHYYNVDNVLYFRQHIPYRGFRNLEVIYVAGYSAIPQDVRWCCAKLLANEMQDMVEKKMSAHIQLMRPTVLDFENPAVFTDEIKRRLEKYRYIPVAVI